MGTVKGASFCSSKCSFSQLLLYSILLFFLLSSSITVLCDELGVNKEEKKLSPNAIERAMGIIGLSSHWQALAALAKFSWMHSGRGDYVRKKSRAWEKVKDASKKSFRASRNAVEKTAEAAADASKERIKKAVSNSKDETEL